MRSLLWQGYVGYHRTNSSIFGGIYIGQGIRSQDLQFTIWSYEIYYENIIEYGPYYEKINFNASSLTYFISIKPKFKSIDLCIYY